jgi:hypothetical protein
MLTRKQAGQKTNSVAWAANHLLRATAGHDAANPSAEEFTYPNQPFFIQFVRPKRKIMLATRFAHRSPSFRSNTPISDDVLRAVAPSIFAEDKHESRSGRYAYIPTHDVLSGLRKEGFEPFMVTQTRVRDEGMREFTKHMVRLRHAAQINDAEANEIILVNAHNGSSSYQMLAGCFRFVCSNGLVVGDTAADIRIPHKGNILDRVIEGAYEVQDVFEKVRNQRDAMRNVLLAPAEAEIFARSALSLKYEPDATKPAPITEAQLLVPRRMADVGRDLWRIFNTVQENLVRGGLRMKTTNGRRGSTREVQGIDQTVKINRALWTMAEEMRKLKA